MGAGRGAVVVTGASSGIGEAAALHLAALGFRVFAGVRREEDGERLHGRGLTPLSIDVTDSSSIEQARAQVEREAGTLAGLVNNAGVAVSAPLEYVPVDELRRQFEINVIGQVAVTQAFLPLLRAGRGRVVNISSIGGLVALPLLGPYNASKFALEALSDSLRRELHGQGVEVVVIEPGAIKTPIWQKGNAAADALLDAVPEEGRQRYGRMVDGLRKETAKIEEKRGLPPQAVADAIGAALTTERPRTRYLVGNDAKLRAAMARVVPDRLLDRLIVRALSGQS